MIQVLATTLTLHEECPPPSVPGLCRAGRPGLVVCRDDRRAPTPPSLSASLSALPTPPLDGGRYRRILSLKLPLATRTPPRSTDNDSSGAPGRTEGSAGLERLEKLGGSPCRGADIVWCCRGCRCRSGVVSANDDSMSVSAVTTDDIDSRISALCTDALDASRASLPSRPHSMSPMAEVVEPTERASGGARAPARLRRNAEMSLAVTLRITSTTKADDPGADKRLDVTSSQSLSSSSSSSSNDSSR